MAHVVLIHGFPFDGSMWRRQVGFLTGLGHVVLTPDLPGFGVGAMVPMPLEEASMEAYAEHVYGIIMQEARGHAVVGGLSMGGYVLMALLREHPECVQGAMFIDTRAEADTAEGRANRLKSIEDVGAQWDGGVIDGLCGRLLPGKCRRRAVVARGAGDHGAAECRRRDGGTGGDGAAAGSDGCAGEGGCACAGGGGGGGCNHAGGVCGGDDGEAAAWHAGEGGGCRAHVFDGAGGGGEWGDGGFSR